MLPVPFRPRLIVDDVLVLRGVGHVEAVFLNAFLNLDENKF